MTLVLRGRRRHGRPCKPYSRLKLVAHAVAWLQRDEDGRGRFQLWCEVGGHGHLQAAHPRNSRSPKPFEKVFAAENFAYLV